MTHEVSRETIEKIKAQSMDKIYQYQDRIIAKEDSECTIKTQNINNIPHVVSRIKAGRKVGNTTRQLNDTIEALFEYKIVGFLDHSYIGEQQDLFRRKLIDRLKREYPHHIVIRDWVPEDQIDREPRSGTIIVGKSYLKLIE